VFRFNTSGVIPDISPNLKISIKISIYFQNFRSSREFLASFNQDFELVEVLINFIDGFEKKQYLLKLSQLLNL